MAEPEFVRRQRQREAKRKAGLKNRKDPLQQRRRQLGLALRGKDLPTSPRPDLKSLHKLTPRLVKHPQTGEEIAIVERAVSVTWFNGKWNPFYVAQRARPADFERAKQQPEPKIGQEGKEEAEEKEVEPQVPPTTGGGTVPIPPLPQPPASIGDDPAPQATSQRLSTSTQDIPDTVLEPEEDISLSPLTPTIPTSDFNFDIGDFDFDFDFGSFDPWDFDFDFNYWDWNFNYGFDFNYDFNFDFDFPDFSVPDFPSYKVPEFPDFTLPSQPPLPREGDQGGEPRRKRTPTANLFPSEVPPDQLYQEQGKRFDLRDVGKATLKSSSPSRPQGKLF